QRGHVQIRDYGCEFPASGVPVLRTSGMNCVIGHGGEVNYSAVRGALRWVATNDLEISTALDYTSDNRLSAGGVLIDGSTFVNPNTQPVQGLTNLSAADFVPPPGSYYNYASYFNPAG